MKSNCQYMVNIIGNHELYNFKREQLESKLKVTKDGSTWYSFKPWNDVSLRYDKLGCTYIFNAIALDLLLLMVMISQL